MLNTIKNHYKMPVWSLHPTEIIATKHKKAQIQLLSMHSTTHIDVHNMSSSTQLSIRLSFT